MGKSVSTRQKKNPPSEVEQLRFQAANALCKLRELAKKDLATLEVLATELRFHVTGLKSDALENPEHYRKLARQCATWPASVSVDKEIQNEQLLFARAVLQLGADATLNYSGRQWSRGTPEIVAALRLIDWIHRRGDNLPPLKRSTAAQWWKHARPLFEEIYGTRFEQHPLFAEKYRKRITSDASLRPATWQRKQILSKMAQAFRSVARKD